jgi:hypothetical protein
MLRVLPSLTTIPALDAFKPISPPTPLPIMPQELRRYYKAAEEAAQEVLLEQGQLSVRNGPNSGFNSTTKQGAIALYGVY